MEKRFAAAILLYNADKKILLQHRTVDAPRNPNKWGCFGGGIEGGETPLEAIFRECKEELEYTLANPKQITYKEFVSPYGDVMAVTYFAELYDITRPFVQHEGQGYGWFTAQEALQLDLTATLRLCLEEINERGFDTLIV